MTTCWGPHSSPFHNQGRLGSGNPLWSLERGLLGRVLGRPRQGVSAASTPDLSAGELGRRSSRRKARDPTSPLSPSLRHPLPHSAPPHLPSAPSLGPHPSPAQPLPQDPTSPQPLPTYPLSPSPRPTSASAPSP